VLLRSLLVLPAPEVLERSAVELLPEELPERPLPELELLRGEELLLPAALAPELLERPAVEPVPAEFAPVLELDRSAVLLEELPERPLPEVELASLRGEELLEPAPLLEPLPVLEPLPLLPVPLAPPALELDSRTSDTVTSGAPWLAGKVTIATPNPFCTPLVDEPLRPDDEDEEPLRPDDVLPEVPERSVDEDEPLRPLPDVPADELLLRSEEVEDDAPAPVLLRSLEVDDDAPAGVLLRSLEVDEEEPMPLLLLRSVLDDDEEPMPPLDDDDPERPLLDEPLVSERRPLLPRLPLLPLELPDEFTGQLLRRAGF
jgi:hypothetical protein